MDKPELSADMSVDEVSTRWPETIPVLRHLIEACVGCSLAPFCTLREAAREFDMPLADLMNSLRENIMRQP